MQYLLVPVIMVCAIGGTVGALKLIQKIFPSSNRIIERSEDWIERHPTAAMDYRSHHRSDDED